MKKVNKPTPPPSLGIRDGSTKITLIPAVIDSLSQVIRTPKDAGDFMRQLDSISGKNQKLTEEEGQKILKELIDNYNDDIGSAKTYDHFDSEFILSSIVNELIKKLTK